MSILQERDAFGYVDDLRALGDWRCLKGWAIFRKNGAYVPARKFRIAFAGLPLSAQWTRTGRPAVNALFQTSGQYGFECMLPADLAPGLPDWQLAELLELEAIAADGAAARLVKTIYEMPAWGPPKEIVSLFSADPREYACESAANSLEMTDVARQGLFGEHINSLHVEWTLTDMCNYNCAYCGGWVKKLNRKNFPDRAKIDVALANIFLLPRSRHTFCILGGEPTSCPDFLYLLEGIHAGAANVASYTVTNASRSLDFFRHYGRLARNFRHDVIISWHPEYAKFEDMAPKIAVLAENGIYVSVHYMHYLGKPGEEEQRSRAFLDIARRFADLRAQVPFSFEPSYIIDYKSGRYDARYNEAHFRAAQAARDNFANRARAGNPDILPTYPHARSLYVAACGNKRRVFQGARIAYEQQVRRGLRCFRDFFCLGGTNMILISPDGGVLSRKCQQQYKETPVINIFTASADLRRAVNMIKCPLPLCECPASDCLPKLRSEHDAKILLAACQPH